jgi:tetratricopeptide (TPR) repeat protein
MEVLALVVVFWFRQVQIETEGPVLVQTRDDRLPEGLKLGKSIPMANLPAPEMPGRLRLPAAENPELEIARLNDEARGFWKDGDYFLAEAALDKALEIDENDSRTLASYAQLEEARGNRREALKYWKRVIDSGVNVELARERARLIEDILEFEFESRSEAMLAGKTRRWIQVQEITVRPDPLPEDPKEIQMDFALSLTKEGVRVDPGKLRIQLFFYDRVGSDRLRPAKIEARFLNTPPDWSGGDTEILRARYLARVDTGEPVSYYGYLIRIFYNDELQDQRAEPTGLLRLSPVS